ncbi:entry exclusion lipoprotein TrbK [Collimonas rhizosphaerae]|uniref:entry exclusion lipoprotein TrbK n=1 Tax=Collimonas rhizosphaerae TaxID=3126357 RepID=UPI003CCC7B5F
MTQNRLALSVLTMIIFLTAGCGRQEASPACVDLNKVKDARQRQELATKCPRQGEFKKSPSEGW